MRVHLVLVFAQYYILKDNLPAPTTPDVEFFACYENDALTRVFNNLNGLVSVAAGSVINNNHQNLLNTPNPTGAVHGVSYQISLTTEFQTHIPTRLNQE